MSSGSYLLLQATRGPILLIVLGVLLLIDYLGIYGFSRTWPLLIIVFGVMKLLEQVSKPPTPPAIDYHGDYVPPQGGNAI
ncbi:MAG TPA: DUF5668 domain-containing protein [Bryobacteraceae bacterium]|nr:DUF5668 domain-containing protein [Bryobacteraceae bacterium]